MLAVAGEALRSLGEVVYSAVVVVIIQSGRRSKSKHLSKQLSNRPTTIDGSLRLTTSATSADTFLYHPASIKYR